MELEAFIQIHLARGLVVAALLAGVGGWLVLRTASGQPPWPLGRFAGFGLGLAGLVPLVVLLAYWVRVS